MRDLLLAVDADVVAIQELAPVTRHFVDHVLASHARVDDEFAGWSNASNIWWDASRFAALDHGHEDIGNPDPDRHLFWVHLRPLTDAASPSMVVATAHFVWDDYPDPERGGAQRATQAQHTAAALAVLVAPDEAVVFLGDLNDDGPPPKPLLDAGLRDCFDELGLSRPPTQPIPEYEPFETLPRAVDRIMANRYARAVDAVVPKTSPDQPPPSDHWPVLAHYQLGDSS